ncbi:barren protein [Yamadazyma tenuis ATCC 10573]|uniref:Condensin complex subunit 2 n=1 Tax=Candida tenuis (strain ATCC 10573 / BCRC 21748 / CBS 615 / JCM 9827 / NBRC 10315 / NRRL Y-1498 / VKM Y-70) TaxID=590646 RepID=G3B2S4_CANTC|nr:uncharacterized protein CANTEDRAFT_120693 [Yamadazyma tenuis ATCC 10573]XP_006685556.1 barren protein [Yamadazyma tenuis ATCC 10573]EGV64749.1 hypothetical protein CANTEDRAFT_120693 [Yamadazyma tenuis ATCC 10573]EGV64750.1 barren protein [Yamadazyma tenuis ATCC 10573]
MSEILPKKRGRDGTAKRYHSNVQDLANMGRVISGRVVSKSKRVLSNRGDLFDEDSNNSFAEDAINFDQNRNTIMSNFEEWIKLSTDNKITTKNSWQFALIDYFHDLNVIKDGDDINFQRASATLDGCVKIYSSRVESVATETGKLLSGLANKKNQDDGDDGVEDEDNDLDPTADGDTRRARKINRVLESTLVPFETIRVKKLDQELSIDPLFKKALAEFDEGGAKSLLLNTLSIDKTGRVIFDATTTGAKADEDESESSEKLAMIAKSMNFSKIESMLFKNDKTLDDLAICPSMDQLKVVLNDIDQAKSILTDVNNKFMENSQVLDDKSVTKIEEGGGFDFGDYNDNNFNEDNFGINDNDNDDYDDDYDRQKQQIKQEDDEEYELGPGNQILDQDLMAYFDETMKSNWRGPEHWKVSAYKKSKNIADLKPEESKQLAETQKPSRTKKDSTIVDFFSTDEVDDDDLFAPPNSLSYLKKKDKEEDTKLPQDIQYNSARLVTLFLKPSSNILYYPKVRKASNSNPESQFTDENYFAHQYNQQERMASFHQAQLEEINHDYDEDDGDVFGGIDFNDVLEEGEGDEALDNKNLLIGGRKARPEYVNFSRISKRVDIKLLKENLWKGIQIEAAPAEQESEAKPDTKNFGELIENIGKMYSPEEKKDLSTSFCFICLLHLANEHGLSVRGNETHDDLSITGF